ncbi:hypothetical protein QUF80_10905 [Desulfococcaceae bacterium HSG8]|nr:hypothetical protein [Desulfococcaceae bacterium HSG8]
MKSLKEQIRNTGEGGILDIRYGGEFNEQLVITRPITIRSTGSLATIVAPSPTVTIRSMNVILENLNIVSHDAYGIALSSGENYKPCFRNVFIKGKTEGLEGEEGNWDIPDVLELPRIVPDTRDKRKIMLCCPVPAKIYPSEISVVHCHPKELMAGVSEIEIATDEIPRNTLITGDLIIETLNYKLKRKIAIIGNTLAQGHNTPEHEAAILVGEYLWRCKSVPGPVKTDMPGYLPKGTQGLNYTFVLDEDRLKTKGYTIRVKGLPDSLVFDNSFFHTIRGIPENPGTFEITFEFEKDHQKHSFVSILEISEQRCEPAKDIIRTLRNLPEGKQGIKYEVLLDAANLKREGYGIRIQGLPKGITFYNSMLFPVISGIPEEAGEFEFTFEFEKDHQRYTYTSVLKIRES